MKLRCELHINGGMRRVLLVPKEAEKITHIALKLSAAILFWEYRPVLEASSRHPALMGQEFSPDLMSADEAGTVNLWIECGNVSVHKLSKIAKRMRSARIVVLKESQQEGMRLRGVLNDKMEKGDRIEIWSWPKKEFSKWTLALEESNHAIGEASGRSLNLVLNAVPFAVELLPF